MCHFKNYLFCVKMFKFSEPSRLRAWQHHLFSSSLSHSISSIQAVRLQNSIYPAFNCYSMLLMPNTTQFFFFSDFSHSDFSPCKVPPCVLYLLWLVSALLTNLSGFYFLEMAKLSFGVFSDKFLRLSDLLPPSRVKGNNLT